MPEGNESIVACKRSLDRIEAAMGELALAASSRIESSLGWYPRLSSEERAWVGLVAQAGITSFLSWCRSGNSTSRVTADIFGLAPRDLTSAISLNETLDLVRTVIDVVEERVPMLALPEELTAINASMLRYSREVAFAVAHVYASTAEERGAWEARLESLVVDSILRGDNDDEYGSRVAALGWGEVRPVTVVVAEAPAHNLTSTVEALRASLRRLKAQVLLSVPGRHMVLILGGAEAEDVVARVEPYCGPGPVVVGPTVPHVFAAGRSARAALSGYRAAPGRVAVPRPVWADDLLPERILLGDSAARHLLTTQVYQALEAAGGALAETADAYLQEGRSLEATARVLFVHANTVRYRLGRISEVTGYDLTDPREAYVVQFGLHTGRLAAAGAFSGRTSRRNTSSAETSTSEAV